MKHDFSGPPAGEGSEPLPWRGVLIVWTVVCALMLLSGGGRFSPSFFLDGDDALRLQQVRDLLAGQSWFDLHQYRIAPPEGVAMHWTRLVDLPIATLILFLRPLLGQAQAEIVTIVVVPLLSLFCAMALCARLAARLFGARTAIVAAVFVAASIPASFRMMPLRIDHHAWQFVLALVALNGLFACSARRGGVIAGFALAVALAISLESLPLAVIVAGLCTVRLLRGQGDWLTSYLATLSLASFALFLATRGLSDLAQHCDAMSPVHVLALLWVAGGTAILLPRLRNSTPMAILLALGFIGLGAIAVAGLSAPQCLTGDAFAALDPLVRKVWLDSVLEGLPFWRQGAALGATMVLLPLFGLIACFRLWRRMPDREQRFLWLDYALLLAGATVVGLLVARASGVACLFAAVPAAWQLEQQFDQWRADSVLLRRLGRVVLMLALLLPGVLVSQAVRLAGTSSQDGKNTLTEACRFDEAMPSLAALGPQTLLTGLDIGPTLLVTTQHKVIATAHHRASVAMRDVLDAFLGSDEVAHRIMARRGATVVVICPSGGEAKVYAKTAPQGFMAHLVAGKAPAWLDPVTLEGASGVKAWRVR